MANGIESSASGAQSAIRRAQTAADNTANSRSTGFRQRRVESRSTVGGVSDTVSLDTKDAGVKHTGQPLDLAIFGLGFFRYQQPDGGVLYSRDGALHRDDQGLLVNTAGLPLSPEITVPDDATAVSVTTDGRVLASGDEGAQEIGELVLARFPNTQGLETSGDGMFRETAASGRPIAAQPAQEGLGHVIQGYLAESNVDPIEQQVVLIEAQASLSANVQAIQTQDEMQRTTIDIKR
jgi:flagellar basal-body rod protein FlgG